MTIILQSRPSRSTAKSPELVTGPAHAAWVAAGVADLPHQTQHVLQATADGHSPASIAQRDHTTEASVKAHLYRARQSLRGRSVLSVLLALLGIRRLRAPATAIVGSATVLAVALVVVVQLQHQPAAIRRSGRADTQRIGIAPTLTGPHQPNTHARPQPSRQPAPPQSTAIGVRPRPVPTRPRPPKVTASRNQASRLNVPGVVNNHYENRGGSDQPVDVLMTCLSHLYVGAHQAGC